MKFRRWKATKWTRRVVRRNMRTEKPIDCQKYIHNTDKAALATLKAIPLFDKICSKALSFVDEPQMRIVDLASKIKVTENQYSKIYYMVQSICKKIGIDMPDIYVELSRELNACTYGTEKFTISINSGLIECLEDDELYAILAHECGHIACKHVLYSTIGQFFLSSSTIGLHKLEELFKSTIIGSLVTGSVETTLELAYYHWQRCSELSADRIAVICCGSSTPVVESMMRLAGGTIHLDSEINKDLFIKQAEEYNRMVGDKKTNKALEYWLTRYKTHPRVVVRAYEALQFGKSKEFQTLKL